MIDTLNEMLTLNAILSILLIYKISIMNKVQFEWCKNSLTLIVIPKSNAVRASVAVRLQKLETYDFFLDGKSVSENSVQTELSSFY